MFLCPSQGPFPVVAHRATVSLAIPGANVLSPTRLGPPYTLAGLASLWGLQATSSAVTEEGPGRCPCGRCPPRPEVCWDGALDSNSASATLWDSGPCPLAVPLQLEPTSTP